MQLSIVIWDIYPERIAQIDKNLHLAMQSMGARGIITSNSEPPSLVRAGVYHRVPALEIKGRFWTCNSSTPSVTACIKLLNIILDSENKSTEHQNTGE